MIHMHDIPFTRMLAPDLPRMRYLSDSEVDQSGRDRAIHSHADLVEIELVCSGHGIHRIGDHQYFSEPGDLLLYNTNVLHQDMAQGEEPMHFYLCGIQGLHWRGNAPGQIARTPEECHLKSGKYESFLLHGFNAIEEGLHRGSPHVAELAQGFLQSLLAIVAQLMEDSGHGISNREIRGPALAEAIRSYIDQNYLVNFTLDELAEQFHISRYYASHCFSEAFSCSPMQYRTRRRIGEAQSLLTNSEFSITYIASVIGYDDPNRFSQVFSKMVGMPPSRYRDFSVRLPYPVKQTELPVREKKEYKKTVNVGENTYEENGNA